MDFRTYLKIGHACLSIGLLDLLEMVYCLLPSPMAVSSIFSENSCGLYILRPSIRIGCRMFWKSSGLRFLGLWVVLLTIIALALISILYLESLLCSVFL